MDKTLGQVARDSYCLSSRADGGKWADVSIAVVAAHEERSGTEDLIRKCEEALRKVGNMMPEREDVSHAVECCCIFANTIKS